MLAETICTQKISRGRHPGPRGDLSFSAPKLATPEGHALRARRCVLAIDAVAKMRRKRAAYAPIRAHYHGMITIFWGSTRRARPRRVPGNSARRARAAADAGIASWSSWRARTLSKAGFAARRAVACRATSAPELGRARRRNVVAAPRGPGGPCGHRGGHPTRAPWCELGLQHSVDYMWTTAYNSS